MTSANYNTQDILDYIKTYNTETNGACPNLRQISEKFGMSKSTASRYISQLNEAGEIGIHPNTTAIYLYNEKIP